MSCGSVNVEYINVFVRVRPVEEQEWNRKSSINLINNNKRICLRTPSCHSKEYGFEHVFDASSTQSDVFDVAVVPVIKDVFNGYNCTLLAYGQPLTGKTYTLLGPPNSDDEMLGVIQRSCTYIFDKIKSSKTDAIVRVSCMDLFNDELIDSLSMRGIRMYEDKYMKGSMLLDGLDEVTVSCKNEIDEFIRAVSVNRPRATTRFGTSAKCSHKIFLVIVRVREMSFTGEEFIKKGRLAFVDLSGNESKDRMANKSLFTFRNVITAATEQRSHIPYRDSKLTRFLQDSINGCAKTTMIATISSLEKNFDGTMSTLDYASKARSIQNYPRMGQLVPGNVFMNRYVDTIHELKRDIRASRTGSGVNVSEETYDLMLKEKDDLNQQLVEKMMQEKDVEEELEVKKGELMLSEDGLRKITLESEELSSNVQVLIEDYDINVQQKEEQQRELEQVIRKRKKLISDTKLLITEAETYRDVDEEQHRKLEHLYSHFQENANALREFRSVFSTVNVEIIEKLDNCISSATEAAESGSREIQSLTCMLEATYPEVKHSLEKLRTFSTRVFEHRTKYDAIKSSYTGRKIDGTGNLIEELSAQISSALLEIDRDYLTKLHTHLNLISDTREESCTPILLDNLLHVRGLAVDCVVNLHDIISRAEETLLIQAVQAEASAEELSDKFSFIEKITGYIQQDYEKELNEILHTLSDYETFVNVASDTVQRNCSEGEDTFNELMSSQKSLSEVSKKSHNIIKVCSKHHRDATEKQVQQGLEHLMTMQNENDALQQSAVKKLEVGTDSIKQNRQKSADAFRDTKQSLSRFKVDFIEKEEKCNLNFSKLNDICERVHYNCSSIDEAGEDLCKNVYETCDKLQEILENVDSKLSAAQTSYHQHHSHLKRAVSRFCKQELQHPTHAGDTPQKSEKSLLDISGINVFNLETETIN